MTESNSNVTRGWRFIADRPAAMIALLFGVLLFVDLVMKLVTAGDDVTIALFLTFVWQGIVIGLVYGLAGIGLSMTYSILNFANFAHGDYITSGAFGGWAATFVVAGLGSHAFGDLVLVGANRIPGTQIGIDIVQTPLAILVGLVFAGLLTVALALVIDRVVYKPMRGQEGIALLIASVGVAFALRNLLLFVFGEANLSVASNTPGKIAVAVPGGTINANYHEIVLVVAAVILMLIVHYLLQSTKLGKAMRAMSDNEDLARVTGIPTERVVKFTWIIGAALAGMAGFLLTLESTTLVYTRGWTLLLFIFAAVILGGIGSTYGAIFGGLIIGLTEKMSLIWLGAELSDLSRAAAFVLMILILLYRPQGLFSGRSTA
ncbi:branched-chain amino acid ABC transporter permease [Haloarchaeobius sp. DT45]|uniref:branched-chain amino acid ABC transporter permease n=1 Tax=Haloarchaeobius sp. DT45 TaxID=3446116 RepID=UPI003F6CEBA3